MDWNEILKLVKENLSQDLGIEEERIPLTEPTRDEYGDLSIHLYKLMKITGEALERIREISIKTLRKLEIVDKIEEKGYFLNLYLNREQVSKHVLSEILVKGKEYGYNNIGRGKLVIVEHTSTNPNAPIHIGNLRNSCLGDSFSRILKILGFNVRRHFYVDDCGIQMSITGVGYDLLSKMGVSPSKDFDLWLGSIYAIVNLFLEISDLKSTIYHHLREESKSRYEITEEEYEYLRRRLIDYRTELRPLLKKLEELYSIQEDLKSRFPEEYKRILRALKDVKDLRQLIEKWNYAYETKSDTHVISVLRDMVDKCMREILDTLKMYNIEFDSLDYESELVWSGLVERIIKSLALTPYLTKRDGALVLKLSEFTKDPNIPDLVLVRSDGTTIYTTRDIAYTVWKFEHVGAKKVYNVIATEQNLPQRQIKLALKILGKKYADDLVHLSYELVHLKNFKMSSRRARYVTAREVYREALERVMKRLANSRRSYSEHEKQRIARAVGVGAIKFALLRTWRLKPILFELDKALNLEENSGPFIQYSYARASGILRKAGEVKIDPHTVDYSKLTTDIEWKMTKLMGKFPLIILNSYKDLRPSLIAEYLLTLAKVFTTFYERIPVLNAPDEDTRIARLSLVEAYRTVVSNGLSLLGIEALEIM